MHMHCLYFQKLICMEMLLILVMAESQVRADSFFFTQHVPWRYSTEIIDQNGLYRHCGLEKEVEVVGQTQQQSKGLDGGEGKQL